MIESCSDVLVPPTETVEDPQTQGGMHQGEESETILIMKSAEPATNGGDRFPTVRWNATAGADSDAPSMHLECTASGVSDAESEWGHSLPVVVETGEAGEDSLEAETGANTHDPAEADKAADDVKTVTVHKKDAT